MNDDTNDGATENELADAQAADEAAELAGQPASVTDIEQARVASTDTPAESPSDGPEPEVAPASTDDEEASEANGEPEPGAPAAPGDIEAARHAPPAPAG